MTIDHAHHHVKMTIDDPGMIFSSSIEETCDVSRTNVNGSGTGIRWWDESFVEWLFETYPETALSVQSQMPSRRAYYMWEITDIIRKLGHKRTLSDDELSRTSNKLTYLTQEGIKVEWLWAKLEIKKREAYLERKKRDACKARIVELKQEVKKLELAKSALKAELQNEKAKLNPRSFTNLFCLK